MTTPRWDCELLKDENKNENSEHYYFFKFPTFGTNRPSTIIVSANDNDRVISNKLRSRGALFPKNKTQSPLAFVTKKLERVRKTRARLFTAKPGFRKKAKTFLLGRKILGLHAERYRWKHQPSAIDLGHGESKGDVSDWKATIGELALDSSYLTWAIAQGLSAPLASYMQGHRRTVKHFLPECSSFNLSGKSGCGKTSIAMAVKGLFGNSQKLSPYNSTRRGLEELAHQHNDLPFVFDDIENVEGSAAVVRSTIKLVNVVIPSGVSKKISEYAASNNLAPLSWRTFVFSGSPLPLDEMMESSGISRSPGLKVRYIDIGVAPPDCGGIFDLRHNESDPAARSIQLVKKLEDALTKFYGSVGSEFIRYLMKADYSKKMQKFSDKYVTRYKKKSDGYDHRFARKFASAYAAAMIARKAGLLPWSRKHIFDCIAICHDRALTCIERPNEIATRAIRQLADLAFDKTIFPRPMRLTSKLRGRYNGFHTKHLCKNVLALRYDRLPNVFGDPNLTKPALNLLRTQGALVQNRRNAKTTLQLPIPLRIGKKLVKKPRFVVIRLNKLRQLNS